MKASQPTAADATPPAGHDPSLSQVAADFGLRDAGGTDPLAGTVLGDVELVRPIAEGGMGRVYEGRQRIDVGAGPREPEGTRRVAVKVLKAAAVSEDVRLRFAAEARLLARLDHPGIARIYGAGAHETGGLPLPFIVMEFIPDALPLVEYAVRHRLPTRQRLALFREACAAVAHAHLKGVIHRDLKPGNILVAGSGPLAGRPRVIDFGIARATDADTSRITRHSDAAGLLGTLQYMSPEQFAGDPDAIDIRADVYALGVVLYELLTGRPPYDVRRKPAHEAARIVRDEDPTPLTALDATLRRDVAAIATKCLHKAPARRYSSAAELADDIERHLEGRPISASPPGFFDGLIRLARRHRAAAAATLAALAAGTIALVGIAIFAARAERERAAAVRATTRAERGRAAAEELVGFLTFTLRDQLAELGRLDVMGSVLDGLARYHDTSRRLAAEGLEQPTTPQRRRREVFLNNLGDLARSTGRPEAARESYVEALAIAEALAAENPASLECQRDLSVSHQKLGMVAADGGDTATARKHFAAALEIRERLVTAAPDDPTREWDLAGILDRLGELALVSGDLPEARGRFAALAAIMERLVAVDPGNLQWRRDLAITAQKLGSLEYQADDADAARRHLERSQAILQELVAGDVRNRQWQWDLCLTGEKLATACAAADDLLAARRHGADALALAEDLVAHDPRNLAWRHQEGVCHERLGGFDRQAGDLPAAKGHYTAFLEIMESLAAEQPNNPRWQRDLAVARRHLADLPED
ncbi:MAG: protein kinase domain-containing protein [Planctomycetota bacterium]